MSFIVLSHMQVITMARMSSEQRSINVIETAYLTEPPRKQRYIACETLNFVWDQPVIDQVKAMWRDGVSLEDIAAELQRDPDEVAILIIDQRRMNKIRLRTMGLWGGVVE